MGKYTDYIGSAVYQIGRWSVASLISWLRPRLQSGALEGICSIVYCQYDGTPTYLTVAEDGDNSNAVPSAIRPGKKLTKVVQVELTVGFVVQGPLTNHKTVFMVGEMAVPLQSIQRNTGECISQALKNVISIPQHEEVSQYFKLNMPPISELRKPFDTSDKAADSDWFCVAKFICCPPSVTVFVIDSRKRSATLLLTLWQWTARARLRSSDKQ